MTPHNHYIHLTNVSRVASIVRLRAEAETWLRDQGIQQWTDDYHDYAREVLRASVLAGTAWVVEGPACGIIATISVNGPDPDFWDPGDDPESALYLGKMIVARSHAGLQVGDGMMNWASLRAAAAGKAWIRIDVRRDNHRLHRYYLARGWQYVRTVDPPRRQTESGVLFQRAAGSTTPAASEVIETDRWAAHDRGGAPWLLHSGEAFDEAALGPNTWMIRE